MTSIEWLFEELFNSFEKFNNGEISFSEYLRHNLRIREQAKEMHKQEIIKANRDGVDMVSNQFITGEQYYQETFKQPKKD